MNGIFTIVTRNYLAQARSLGDSLRAVDPDVVFYIILADEPSVSWNTVAEQYPLVVASEISIPHFLEMAFKYDLVEFCTAIKPFCFDYLFANTICDKVIYLDPDILVYSSLRAVFDLLTNYDVVLTPHILAPHEADKGTIPDREFLCHGAFNLGFVGFSRGVTGAALLSWWKARTRDQGYADLAEGLYVDQKWADLMPAMGGERVAILRWPGCNVAHWNWHERDLTKTNGTFLVNGEPLYFYHFSGFDVSRPDSVTRGRASDPIRLEQLAGEIRELFENYRIRVLENRVEGQDRSYAFGTFANGTPIYPFQRRLFRAWSALGKPCENPFGVEEGSFYQILNRRGLILSGSGQPGELTRRQVPRLDLKWRALKCAMRLLRLAIGTKNYFLLLRGLNRLARPEAQVFLLSEEERRCLIEDEPSRYVNCGEKGG